MRTRHAAAVGLVVGLFLSLVVPAHADIPVVKYGPVTVTSDTTLPALNLTGQSSCALVRSNSGTGTVTPQGSSDGGSNYSTVDSIGAQTSNGTYGSTISPYLTNFRIAVTGVSGSVTVYEICSSALSINSSAPTFPGSPSAVICTDVSGNLTGTCDGTYGQAFPVAGLSCTITSPATHCSTTTTLPVATMTCAISYEDDGSGPVVAVRHSVSGTTLTVQGDETGSSASATINFEGICTGPAPK